MRPNIKIELIIHQFLFLNVWMYQFIINLSIYNKTKLI